ncbi:NlpC/P60 family protein [Massilia sp. W12]|uniref:NlpC/P60 family protein n=1 Tax=Massilia sp. W12 TaxID=3126507 RepID=UPI0030CF3C09
MTADQQNAAVAEARRWLGTPYHHAGKVHGAGVDCVMLLVQAYQAAGVLQQDYDPRPYAKDWHLHRGEELYLLGLSDKAYPINQPEAGDIALFKFGRTASHAGIVSTWPCIIHAWAEVGQVCETDLNANENLRTRLIGCWRINTDKTA